MELIRRISSTESSFSPTDWPSVVAIDTHSQDTNTLVKIKYGLQPKHFLYPWNKAYWLTEVNELEYFLTHSSIETPSGPSRTKKRATLLNIVMLIPQTIFFVSILTFAVFGIATLAKALTIGLGLSNSAARWVFNLILLVPIVILLFYGKNRSKIPKRW
jgi:hypothetical protein